MKKIRYKHPLVLRWLHWFHFPVLLAMVWSGLLIYWANDVYRLGWGDTTLLKFFPTTFYEAMHIPFRLAEGMNIHFLFMWLFAFSGIGYALYLLLSGNWKHLLPARRTWRQAAIQLAAMIRFKKYPAGTDKYNPMQRIAYTGILVIGFLMLLNGLAIYKPVQYSGLCAIFGGYASARAVHFILTLLFCLFFVIHVLQVIAHGWNKFRSMLTGFEVIREDETHPLSPNAPE